jgi:hypothetical protein
VRESRSAGGRREEAPCEDPPVAGGQEALLFATTLEGP